MAGRKRAPWLARVPARIQAVVGGVALSFRSKLELNIAEDLEDRGADWGYEPGRLKYTKECHYIPDFILTAECEGEPEFLIEAKGWTPGWESGDDRSKLLAVREQRRVIICIVWDTERFANAPIRKGGKTTNAQWAEKHSFPHAAVAVPQRWIEGDLT